MRSAVLWVYSSFAWNKIGLDYPCDEFFLHIKWHSEANCSKGQDWKHIEVLKTNTALGTELFDHKLIKISAS